MPAAPRPGGLRALPAVRPPGLPGVPAPGCRRRAVRRLRARPRPRRSAPPGRCSAATSTTPRWSSYAIIAICVVVFVLQTARPGLTGDICVRALPRRERAVALPHLGVRARRHHPHPVQHAGPVDGGGAVPRAAARRCPVCRGLPRQRHRRLGRSTCSCRPPRCPSTRTRGSRGTSGRSAPRAPSSACSARCSCSTGTSAGRRPACTRRSGSTP